MQTAIEACRESAHKVDCYAGQMSKAASRMADLNYLIAHRNFLRRGSLASSEVMPSLHDMQSLPRLVRAKRTANFKELTKLEDDHGAPKWQLPTAARHLLNLILLFLPHRNPAAAFAPCVVGSGLPSASHQLGSGQGSSILTETGRHNVQGALGSRPFTGIHLKRKYNKVQCLVDQKLEERQPEAIKEYSMSAIAECEKYGQWAEAAMLLKKMNSKSLKPEVISYNAAISACEKSGRWDQALRLLEKVSTAGLTPNAASFDITISACQKGGQWEKTIALLREMNAEAKSMDARIFSVSQAKAGANDAAPKFHAPAPISSVSQVNVSAEHTAPKVDAPPPDSKKGASHDDQEGGHPDADLNAEELLKLNTPVSSTPAKDGSNKDTQGPHVPSSDAEKGFVDEDGYHRFYMYKANGQVNPESVVACSHWDSADQSARDRITDEAMTKLKSNGFVVLEKLLPPEWLLGLGKEYKHYKSVKPDGMTFGRMRAGRDMTIIPCEGHWKDDRLVRHPLVLTLLARYLRNSIKTADEDAAQMDLARWVSAGAPIEEFTTGSFSAGFPILDLMTVVTTPAGESAQKRHRDTIVPGPCASLGVHVPLSIMELEPLNGPIGFNPGTHRLSTERPPPRDDLVGAPPLGSVILYDSFVEHHGLEHGRSEDRYALFAWFRVPGVYSGHSDENFGEIGLKTTVEWRKYIGEKLFPIIAEQQVKYPSAAGVAARENWGFHPHFPLIDWGEERVCWRCDTTTPEGRSHMGKFYCNKCWEKARNAGQTAPMPAEQNVRPPPPPTGEENDIISQDRLQQLEAIGVNLKPSRGRHKLALIRERGHFMPVDPGSAWLDDISTEPQPVGWRSSIRKALGEVPREDGF
mmetsp:Transcript_150024/g.273084  ORF Transcript_150024/g.273084 Transcript_150024/m.273084 type:complete len:865 (+) Transcript_150024:69-2663(+)